MMTVADANDLVKRLLGAFPTQRMNMKKDDLVQMSVSYVDGLLDLDYNVALLAVQRCTKSCEWLPPIARIRAEVGEILLGGRRSGAEAWVDVLRAVGTFGVGREPVFRDPFVALAVKAVGWRSICMSDETDPAPRSKFADAYNALVIADRKGAQLSLGGSRSIARVEREGGQKSIGELLAPALLPEGETG